MLISIVVAASLIIMMLRFLPLGRKTLIEGVFTRTELGFGWNGKRAAVYYFDTYCRACLDNINQRDPVRGCQADIFSPAWKLKSFEPERGDSIKIIIWVNLFGQAVIYRIVKTNFAEETYERQMREYAEEKKAHAEASERNQAMHQGITVEAYRCQAEASAKEMAAFHTKLKNEDGFLKNLLDIRSSDLSCIEHMDMDYFEYAETGTLRDQRALKHLAECKECSSRLDSIRKKYLDEIPRAACFSTEDLAMIEVFGKLTPTLATYTEGCYRCYVRFHNRANKHLKNPPGLECLVKQDLDQIRSTGKIPEHRQEHLSLCERCTQEAERERGIYIDHLIPVPPRPPIRLASLPR